VVVEPREEVISVVVEVEAEVIMLAEDMLMVGHHTLPKIYIK
jgi:hypothetical protein